MSRHLKRLASPRTWSVPRKISVWVVRPSPGPHAKDDGIPLALLLREMLSLCDTRQEGKRIISGRKVYVDGRVTRDDKHAVGLMDVVSIPSIDHQYRMLIDGRGRLRAVPITKEEARWKLLRINGKSTIEGGRTQLHTHDGRNLLVEKDLYRVGDVLKVSVPDQRVLDHFPLSPGAIAYLTGGSHVGTLATLTEVVSVQSHRANLARFEEGFSTVKDYAFVVGTKVAQVSPPEVVQT